MQVIVRLTLLLMSNANICYCITTYPVWVILISFDLRDLYCNVSLCYPLGPED